MRAVSTALLVLSLFLCRPARAQQGSPAGPVPTVEPGIYIQGEALGIRIEDDVLVTQSGFELLSKGAPRRAEDIEKLMASASAETQR